MNIIKKYTKHIARILFVLFIASSVALPALSPLSTFAFDAGEQSRDEAEFSGLDDSVYAPSTGCFQGKFSNASISGCMAVGAYYLLLKPTYWAAGYFGLFFNFSFNELIVGMGDLVAQMSGIMFAWKTIRDITNIFLVFLTIYIGIATILGISGYGAKQMLWKVVLAALLVNFSVTFTKVVIDISNLTATQTFLMFVGNSNGNVAANCDQHIPTGTLDNDTINKNPCLTHGISNAFWSQLRITTIFDFAGLKAAVNNTGGDKSSLYMSMTYTYLMASVMFIVLAFVFGAAGLLFVARFVILVFLLIVSPLALVLWITGVSSQGRAWWHALIKQSIFPPAILLCWWIAYRILGDYTSSFSSATLSGVAATTPTATSLVTMFIIVTGFLIGGLIIASKLGAHGADAMIKTGGNWSRAIAGAATVGAGAYVARQTVGRGAAYAADSERLKDGATSKNFLKRNLSKAAIATSQRTASSSFDARNLTKSKIAGSAGGKGGFSAWSAGKAKKTEELNKHLSTYKGTVKEEGAHQEKLGEVNRVYDTKINELKTNETLLNHKQDKERAEAALVGMGSGTAERTAMEAKLKQAQDSIAQIEKENAEKIKKLDEERIAQREQISKDQHKEYEKKGKARGERNLDRLSTERTFGVLPTPQWKKDAVKAIRGRKGMTPQEKAIRDMLATQASSQPTSDNNPAA